MHGLVALALGASFAGEIGASAPLAADVRAGVLLADRHELLAGVTGNFPPGPLAAWSLGAELLYRGLIRPLAIGEVSPFVEAGAFVESLIALGVLGLNTLPRDYGVGAALGFGAELLFSAHLGLSAAAGCRLEGVLLTGRFGGGDVIGSEPDRMEFRFALWSTIALTVHL